MIYRFLRTHLLFLYISLIFLFFVGMTSCKKQDKAIIGNEGFYFLLPIQLTLATHQLLEKLSLSKSQFQKEFRSALIKGNWRYYGRKKKQDHALYFVQIALGMRVVPAKRAKKKGYLHFKLYVQAKYELSPLDKGKETIYLTEEKMRDYLLKKPKLIGKTTAWIHRILKERGRTLLTLVWKKGVQSLILYNQLQKTPSKKLVKLIEKGSNKWRYYAIRIVGDRRYKAAIPSLIKVLHSKEMRDVKVAISALVRLKARKAILPLIELARGKKPSFLAQLISAFAEIGGAEAESYLFTLAGAHPMSIIRKSAKEACQELIENRKKLQRLHKMLKKTKRRAPSSG